MVTDARQRQILIDEHEKGDDSAGNKATYEFRVLCTNCELMAQIQIPKGVPVEMGECPNCGCQELIKTIGNDDFNSATALRILRGLGFSEEQAGHMVSELISNPNPAACLSVLDDFGNTIVIDDDEEHIEEIEEQLPDDFQYSRSHFNNSDVTGEPTPPTTPPGNVPPHAVPSQPLGQFMRGYSYDPRDTRGN